MRQTFFLILFAFSCVAFAATPSLCAKYVTQNIGTVTHDKTSFVKIEHPLVTEANQNQIYQKILKDFDGSRSLKDSHFFSQFVIDASGKLSTIVDPTVEKDSGAEIAAQWEQDADLRSSFKEIYKNTKELAELLRFSLPETEIELAEVVLTVQVNKVSENWHLDWYDQEYLIATQTFLAKKVGADGSLIDEDFAGTEYLLMGNGPEVMEAIMHSLPKKIEFMVNTTPAVGLVGKGFHYESPTHALTVHSGAHRVHGLLDIPNEAAGFSLVSPPHRGSYKDLTIRASLAIRFKPKN